MRQARPPSPSGLPSWTSPGLTVMVSPGSDSTVPRPLIDFCAPRSITPRPNCRCMCLPKAKWESARIASMPGSAVGRNWKGFGDMAQRSAAFQGHDKLV